MGIQSKHLSLGMQRDWIEHAQQYAAKSIFKRAEAYRAQIAMQGGCALRLFYDAPRFSMDMDFVINEDHQSDLDAILADVQKDLTRDFQRLHGPDFHVRLRGGPKLGKKLQRYTFTIVAPTKFRGGAHLHMEFWPVSHEYMLNYAQSRTVSHHDLTINRADEMSISTPTLKSIYIDKVVALASRTHVKWRDIYDVWWISSKLRSWLPAPENGREMMEMFLKQASAYDVRDPQTALRGFQRFLDTDTETLIRQAHTELGQFLDTKTCATAFADEDGIRRIIERAKQACQFAHDNLEHLVYSTVQKTAARRGYDCLAPPAAPSLSI